MRRSLLVLLLLVLAPLGARAQTPVGEGHVEDTPEEASGAATEIEKAPPVAKRLFRDLVCQCGGCQRLPLYECRCGYAKNERARIMKLLAGRDISTPKGEEAAYLAVRDVFMKEYDGQKALTVPLESGFNLLGTAVPVAVLTLALGLVFFLGRRWVLRGRRAAATAMTGKPVAGQAKTREQEDLEDKLDDELRDID